MMAVLKALGALVVFAPWIGGSGSVLHDLACEKLKWVKHLALVEPVQWTFQAFEIVFEYPLQKHGRC